MLITGKRHDFDRRLRGRLRRRRPHHAASPHAGVALRPLGRSVRTGQRRARCATSTTATSSSTSRSSRTAARRITVSNTAFRGFGGPQGMMADRGVMDDIARHLGRDPLDVRRRNFYGAVERNITPYGRSSRTTSSSGIVDELEASSGVPRAARGDRRLQRRRARVLKTRHRADAGEVRHLVQRHALQPGGRARCTSTPTARSC